MSQSVRAPIEETFSIQLLELAKRPDIARIGIEFVLRTSELIVSKASFIGHKLAEEIADVVRCRPRILIAEGDRRHTRRLQLFAGINKLGIGFGLRDTIAGKNLLVVKHVFA